MDQDSQLRLSASCTNTTNTLLLQLASVASILTFISALILSLTLYIRDARKRRLQLRNIHIESNAHVAGMQEIAWAIAAIKESIKAGNDGSEEAREVFDSVSRLLQTAERELDQLAKRTGEVESVRSGEKGWRKKGKCIPFV